MVEDDEKGMVERIMAEGGEQEAPYQAIFGDVSNIIYEARKSVARSVNATMTAAYWMVGRSIIEFEQSGEQRAEYGAALIRRLAEDLTRHFDRGFSRQNLQNMRQFYLLYPPGQIRQTLSGISETTSSLVGYIPSRLRRTDYSIPASLVSLCSPAVGQDRQCAQIL